MEFTKSNTPAMSEDIRELMKALLLARPSFKTISKDGFNSHGKWTFAKLNDLYDAVEEALTKQNINIVHSTMLIDNMMVVMTRLVHSLTGQWIQDLRKVESEKPGNQAMSSAITYIKKDSVKNLCAIYAGEDDDGQAAEPTPTDEIIRRDQYDELVNKLRESGKAEEIVAKMKSYNKVDSLSQLRRSQYQSAMDYIKYYKGDR